MPAVIERRGQVSLNDHVAEYLKADKQFIDGIKSGVRACKEGKVRRWAEIREELRLR
jgi:hypothetical protein